MKKSLTLVFTLLFFLVLGLYLYLENQTEETQFQEKVFRQEEMKLLTLAPGDHLSRLKIQRVPEKETIILSRENGSWRIEYPIHSAADAVVVGGLEMALTVSSKVRKLNPEKGWGEYGLQNPTFKISIQTQKEPKEKTLSFGDAAPVGHFIFARWNQEANYFLLPVELKAAFLQSLYALRQKSVFELNAHGLARILLKTESEDYELTRNKDRWFWMEPILTLGEFVSEQDAELILKALQNLSVKEFLDQPFLDVTKLGLEFPTRSITLLQGDQEQVLAVGREEVTKDAFYVRRDKQESAFLVSSTKLKYFFETVKSAAERAAPPAKPIPVSIPLVAESKPVVSKPAPTIQAAAAAPSATKQ